MALPSTGLPWKTSGLNNFKGDRVRRGGKVAVLMRDYGGESTDLSPGGSFASPFAADGQIRDDLLAVIKDSHGNYISNPSSNQGWYLTGALDPKGVMYTPDMTVDKLEILQSNTQIRSDLQKEGGTIELTAFESTALIDCVRENRPLTDVLQDGTSGYFFGKRSDADLVERQLLLIRADTSSGLPEYTALGFPRVALDKINKRTWDKKMPDALDVSYDELLDPFYVDLDGTPLVHGTWRSGSGWVAGGAVVSTYTVTLGSPSAGTFTLTYGGNTTATIAYGAANTAVKSALVALDDGFGTTDWTVTGSTGGPFAITVPRTGTVLTGDGTALTGGTFSVTPVV